MTRYRYTIPGAPITKKNSQRIFRNPKTGKPMREKIGYICHMISYQWISNYEILVSKGLAPAPKVPLVKA